MKTIQSIDKAIYILDYVSKHNGLCSLTDISVALDMKITTLHGIIATLEAGNMLSKHPITGKYKLGVKLFEMGKIYEAGLSLKDIVHPYLEELSKKIPETIHLAIPMHHEILYIDKVESPHPFRLTSMVGTRESAIHSAIGLAILSHIPKEDLSDWIKGYPINKENFYDGLEQIKTDAYCLKYEVDNDFYCLAVCLTNSLQNSVGAISIVIPKCRYTTAFSDACIQELLQLKEKLQPLLI